MTNPTTPCTCAARHVRGCPTIRAAAKRQAAVKRKAAILEAGSACFCCGLADWWVLHLDYTAHPIRVVCAPCQAARTMSGECVSH